MTVMPVDDGFRALANPTRRALLQLVRDEPRAVTELVDHAGVSQPAVSQHLAVLRDAGLVSVRRDGRRRLYEADLDRLSELRQFFDAYWSAAADRLASVAEASAVERGAAS